jgi:hypothetical protein
VELVFNLVISCENRDVQLTLHALESENMWMADTGATSHLTKHKIGGMNHRGTTVKTRRFNGESINPELEMDILVKYIWN